ncbi:MAG: hypothetical protein ACYTDX_11035 [Planctomycetota bacterium]
MRSALAGFTKRETSYAAWHAAHCPRVLLLGLPACEPDETAADPWPEELNEVDEWVLEVAPEFAGRTCLEAWKETQRFVAMN